MSTRRSFQRHQLIDAGRKLIVAINAGRKPGDLALTFPGSRSMMYRAIKAATIADAPAADAPTPATRARDPLLL